MEALQLDRQFQPKAIIGNVILPEHFLPLQNKPPLQTTHRDPHKTHKQLQTHKTVTTSLPQQTHTEIYHKYTK